MQERKFTALCEILTYCILRWAELNDDRFLLAALQIRNVLGGALKDRALTHVEDFIQDLRDVSVGGCADRGEIEKAAFRAAEFSRADSLISSLRRHKGGLFASLWTRKRLEAAAPALLDAIDACDVQGVKAFDPRRPEVESG